MLLRKLTLKEALERHEAEVMKLQAEAGKKLSRSKNKKKGQSTNELEWHYEMCVRGDGYSFKQLIDGTYHNDEAARQARSLEDRVKDQCERTTVSLVCSMVGASADCVIPNPPEVAEGAHQSILAADAEQQRQAALTPEERQTELEKILGQLGRSKGFVAFGT